jgi:hypothetical protein
MMSKASRLWLFFSFVVAATSVRGAVEPARAQAVFREAADLCGRDGGSLWHHSLCGPILLVDWTDNTAVANQADREGVLKAQDGVFVGRVPADFIIANTPTSWAGVRWTQLVWPLPEDASHRHVMLSHELFHRAQLELGLPTGDGANAHLDTMEGRILLQLEWDALARALRDTAPAGRRAALADALLFRHQRYRLFPGSEAEERALEMNEGVAEYTGVRVGLPAGERTAYALGDLQAFVAAPSFVRSFAYATGPAYGLLLDEAMPGWHARVGGDQGLDRLLAAAMDLPELPASRLAEREAAYDGSLRPREQAREDARRARMAAWRARLVDGPVLALPMAKANLQFNPQTLQSLDGVGTVYPTLRLDAAWGTLEVSQGALVNPTTHFAAVSAAGMAGDHLSGDGWKLALKAGWSVVAGERAGDFTVKSAAP